MGLDVGYHTERGEEHLKKRAGSQIQEIGFFGTLQRASASIHAERGFSITGIAPFFIY
jgi:hypothetical protein